MSPFLSEAAFAVGATCHTTKQALPAQLVFGQDTILNLSYTANLQLIKKNKQDLIKKNNQRKNNKRKEHQYKVDDLVLLKNPTITKFGQNAYQGP